MATTLERALLLLALAALTGGCETGGDTIFVLPDDSSTGADSGIGDSGVDPGPDSDAGPDTDAGEGPRGSDADVGDVDDTDSAPDVLDTRADDAPIDEGDSDASGDGARRLEFVADREQRLPVGSRVRLDVRLVGDDAGPIAGARIEYAYDEFRAADSQLRSLSARTGDDGIAGVELVAGTVPAEFDVQVSVVDDADVASIAFGVTVVPTDTDEYVVHVHYASGALTLQAADVLLFDSDTDCEEIGRNPDEVFGALDRLSILPLADGIFPATPYSVARADLPLTVAVAIAYKEDTPVAMGCTDGLPEDVGPGSNETIDIYITELFPAIQGEFRVVNEFDLNELVPGTAQDVVRHTASFFDSPGATIFDILDDAGVFDGEDDLPLGLGDLLADAIDSQLFASLPEEAIAVFESGSDIYDTLQNIQLQGSMIFYDNPDELGVLGECNEIILDEIIVDFDTFDTPTFNLRSYGYQGAYGTFTGWISVEDDGDINYALNIQPFGLTINYGELAVFILEAIVFPAVIDESVDSMEAFVESFIDCEQIAEDVGWNGIETLCDTIISTATAGLRSYLTSGTVDIASAYQLSTPAADTTPPVGIELLEEGMDWGPCDLGVETDGSMQRVELLGSSGRERCPWDARYRGDASDAVGSPVSAAFDGFRLTSRTSGVCGDGE